MQYVTALAAATGSEFEHLIWKHRGIPAIARKANLVCESRAKLSAIKSIRRDLMEGLADFLPLVKWSNQHRDAILHAHSRAGIVAGCLAARFTRNTLIVHFHFLARQRRLYAHLCGLGRAIPIYNSHLTCRHYREESSSCSVQEPFINWPTAPIKERTGGRRIVAAGALVPGKHPDLILGAFEKLRERQPDLELRLYGASAQPLDPRFEGRLTDRARSIPGASVLPWQRDWLDHLTSGDVFVHLGHPESFGMSMLEAFARGLPLVVPPVSFFDDLEPASQSLGGVARISHLNVGGVVEALSLLWSRDLDAGKLARQRMKWRDRFGTSAAIERMHIFYRRIAQTRG